MTNLPEEPSVRLRAGKHRYSTKKSDTSKHKFIVLDHGEERVYEWTLQGHWVYLRNCKKADSVGGIFIPDKSTDITNNCEVIAVGKECGKWREIKKTQEGIEDLVHQVNNPLLPGDIVTVPDVHSWALTRSPYCDWEYLMDEDAIVAIL